MKDTNIGLLVRHWRETRRGWTLQELAEASGELSQTISAIECGKSREPRRSTVLPITDALGIPRNEVELALDTDAGLVAAS